jgi:hypothetical protein
VTAGPGAATPGGSRRAVRHPMTQPIRDFILTGKEAAIHGKIQLGGNMPPLSLWQSEPNAHVGLALQQGDNIAIGVRIFDAVSGVVIVTNAARSYPNLRDGRFVLIDLVGSASRATPRLPMKLFAPLVDREMHFDMAISNRRWGQSRLFSHPRRMASPCRFNCWRVLACSEMLRLEWSTTPTGK